MGSRHGEASLLVSASGICGKSMYSGRTRMTSRGQPRKRRRSTTHRQHISRERFTRGGLWRWRVWWPASDNSSELSGWHGIDFRGSKRSRWGGESVDECRSRRRRRTCCSRAIETRPRVEGPQAGFRGIQSAAIQVMVMGTVGWGKSMRCCRHGAARVW